MKNCLILTGRFGMGHISAAAAIEQNLKKEQPEIQVQVIDLLQEMFPIGSKAIYRSFTTMVKRCHGLYNMFYSVSEQHCSAGLPIKSILISKLQAVLDRYEPDMIISVLPLCSKLVSLYKTETGDSIPMATCITDVCTHKEWICEKTDMYFVPTENIKEQLTAFGIDAQTIYATGIPVKEQFKQLPKQIRRNSQKKQVLVMGGGLGLLPGKNGVLDELSEMTDVEVTIITSTNKKAYAQLSNKYANMNVIQYTDQVDTYMRAADLIITKPGGITLFEAMHVGVPLFIIDPFLGQEMSNAHYIEKEQIGIVTYNKLEDSVKRLQDCLEEEEQRKMMQRKMMEICAGLSSDMISQVVSRMGEERIEAC